jgi:hypothetical protein
MLAAARPALTAPVTGGSRTANGAAPALPSSEAEDGVRILTPRGAPPQNPQKALARLETVLVVERFSARFVPLSSETGL